MVESSESFVSLLINSPNIDINSEDNYKNTALCICKEESIIKLLLQHGADIYADCNPLSNDSVYNYLRKNKSCLVCGKKASNKCRVCGVRYCGKSCQNQDWKKHRAVCKLISEAI